MDAACLLFRTEAEYSSELSLVGETRERHGLTINNSPNSKLDDSGNTGMLPEIRFFKEIGSEICVSAVTGGARFGMLSMDECNTASHTR